MGPRQTSGLAGDFDFLQQAAPAHAQRDVEAQRLIHGLVTRGAAHGQAAHPPFTAQCLSAAGQLPGDALSPEHRLHVQILQHRCRPAAEGGEVLCHGAHPHGPAAPVCQQEADMPLLHGGPQPLCALLRQQRLPNLRQIAVLQLPQLPVRRVLQWAD